MKVGRNEAGTTDHTLLHPKNVVCVAQLCFAVGAMQLLWGVIVNGHADLKSPTLLVVELGASDVPQLTGQPSEGGGKKLQGHFRGCDAQDVVH